MPLATLAALHWYGPGCAAAVCEDAGGSAVASIAGAARAGAVGAGSASSPLAKATRLVHSPAVGVGSASSPLAQPRGSARMSAVCNVGAVPSAEDVAQAIWNGAASRFNVAGTMGAKLNTASSGGVDTGALADAVKAELLASPSLATEATALAARDAARLAAALSA